MLRVLFYSGRGRVGVILLAHPTCFEFSHITLIVCRYLYVEVMEMALEMLDVMVMKETRIRYALEKRCRRGYL